MTTQDTPSDRGNRDDSGRFLPGTSGNPAGRPKKREADRRIEELARGASEAAFDVVKTLMGSEQERTRLAAALAILERAHGKPGERLSEPVEVEPGASLSAQGRAIMQAACRGDLSPSQAGALLSCLGNLAKLVETTELEARIAALEAQRGQA